MKLKAIIMAAGQGTRMRSKLPKVLHPLLGQPLIRYSVDTTTRVTGQRPVVIIGHGADEVRKVLGEQAEFAIQAEQLGTGHAVQQAASLLRGQADLVLVVAADMPLLTEATLRRLVETQKNNSGPLSMLTLLAEEPRGFGRVVRDAQGKPQAIVEEAQATTEQLAIHELNAGAYCIRAEWLWGALTRIPLSPKGEYYLTDLVEIAVADGFPVQAVTLEEASEAIGINTHVHLAEAEALPPISSHRLPWEQIRSSGRTRICAALPGLAKIVRLAPIPSSGARRLELVVKFFPPCWNRLR